ncbi:MAG: CbiX/SirB N-terminal domain-containing protein [Chloroflexota bacterium]
MTRTALVLAGHGSHISPNTAGLVWEQVDHLRAMGVADEVTAAFWKEMPSFHTVFNSLEATDITVVPLFTAQGYFTQTVIPTEMGLTALITHQEGRTIRYTRTLGEHPYLFTIVEEWADAACRALKASPEETAVAIIGHSTRRNPNSRKASEDQVEHLRNLGIFAQVEAVYLDDSPAIADIYEMTSAPNLVAIPFFLAEGSHTTIDVVRELGFTNLERDRQKVNGRMVFYTPPIGLTDKLPDIILELAHEAGAPLYEPQAGSSWDCIPAQGRDRFWRMMTGISSVNQGLSSMKFGQLYLTMDEVTCADDENAVETLTDLGELRRRVRENPFRPLATSTNLGHGWRVPVDQDLKRLHAIVETVYPGIVGDIMSHQFSVSSLKSSIDRQTGQYRDLEQLSQAQSRTVTNRVCGNCIRYPNWYYKHSVTGSKPSKLLCPEPCNFWLSSAMQEMGGDDAE